MSREAIFEASVEYFLSPIGKFLEDDTITEVMVNKFDQIYVERQGRLLRTHAKFESEDALMSAVRNVAQWVGRDINTERPILDARLPDGSRVHAVIPPGARGGVCLTIRKFKLGGLTLDDLLEYGSISRSAAEFLQICVRLHKSIIISGGTGTGKTSLLGAVSVAIPWEERIIVIEDTSELALPQEHCIYLEVQRPDEYGRGGLSIRQLFTASLRMRPDRIIVGEVRGGEALDMVQAMLSGHSGSISTVHADSPRNTLVRLETLSMMSDVEIPVHVARAQVSAAVDLIVQLGRFSEDGSRRVTGISEVRGLDSAGQYVLSPLYVCKMSGKSEAGRLIGDLVPTGEQPTFASEPRELGMANRIQHSAALWTAANEGEEKPSI